LRALGLICVVGADISADLTAVFGVLRAVRVGSVIREDLSRTTVFPLLGANVLVPRRPAARK
jgi:hypothetical protein